MPLARVSLARRAARPLLAALVALPVGAAAAQQPAAPTGPPPGGWRNAVAVNALALPFGLVSAEYERALATPGFSVGVGGSWENIGGDRNAWASVKGLYYPGERPLRGFSAGLTIGVHSARGRPECDVFPFGDCDDDDERSGPIRTETAPTAGVLLGYDFLLGRSERFRIGLGGGFKRTLRDVTGGAQVLEQVYWDGRFVLGLAF